MRHTTCTGLLGFVGIAVCLSSMASNDRSKSSDIFLSDAKALVLAVDEVKAEFRNSTTCVLDQVAPASETACNFFLLHASCRSSQSREGFARDYAVNKKNGDVEPLGAKWRIIDEPQLRLLQQETLRKRDITDQMAKAGRDLSRMGCMFQ